MLLEKPCLTSSQNNYSEGRVFSKIRFFLGLQRQRVRLGRRGRYERGLVDVDEVISSEEAYQGTWQRLCRHDYPSVKLPLCAYLIKLLATLLLPRSFLDCSFISRFRLRNVRATQLEYAQIWHNFNHF